MPRGTEDWGRTGGGVQSVAEMPAYMSSISVSAASGAQRRIVSLFNPAASGKVVRFGRIAIVQASQDNVGFSSGDYILNRTSSLGTGTSLAPQPMLTSDVAAVLQVRHALTVDPTVGLQIGEWATAQDRNITLNEARTDPMTIALELYAAIPGSRLRPLTLLQGEGILLSCAPSARTIWVSFFIYHAEEPV